MFSQSKEEAAQQEEQDVSNNETATPRLNALNYLNVVFYILNFLVTYGVGLLGWVGNGTNEELSEKYQVRQQRTQVPLSTLLPRLRSHVSSYFLPRPL